MGVYSRRVFNCLKELRLIILQFAKPMRICACMYYAKYLGRFKFYKFYFRGPYLLFVKETLPSIPSSSETDHTEGIKNTDSRLQSNGTHWLQQRSRSVLFMFPSGDYRYFDTHLSSIIACVVSPGGRLEGGAV